ncbi:MAG: zinc ribbon domain-containing protein [Planctomycetota bacterium]|nr:zinc ribbon domain-containing protein [Planctomycetota bacterium]
MSRRPPSGNDEDSYTPRPGDEVVEPLFGALQPDLEQNVGAKGADVPQNEAHRSGTPRASTSRVPVGPPGLLARFRRLLRRRSKASISDWFACPVCGAKVRDGASSCRECGSDERTGWSEATAYDDLDLPEPDGPEIPDTFEEFTRASSPRRAVPPRLLLGLLAVALVLIVARAAQLLFAA